MEELLRQRLSATCTAYAAATDVSRAKVGSLILNDNTFFRRVLDEGQGFTVRIYDRVLQWFADHWPEDADWPTAVPRPPKSPDAAPTDPAPTPRSPDAGAAERVSAETEAA